VIAPPPEVVKALAVTVRQFPDLLAWLDEWTAREVSQLPYARENTAVAQGRCQVLSELTKLAKNSPELAAKQHSSPSNHAYR
jgi:hypothetical protein